MSKDLNAPDTSREAKRAQFAQEAEGRPNNNTVKILVVVALALAGLGAYVVAGAGGGAGRATAVAPAPAAGGGAAATKGAAEGVSVPLSELSGKARFYEYKAASGKTVRFFAVRSPDGVYRAALDACDVCFHAKKGYSQEGEDMVCNNCGMHFPSAKINEVKGGCNPVGLERKVEGDRLVVGAKELEAGVSYF